MTDRASGVRVTLANGYTVNAWTVGEETAWRLFFSGERPTAPEGRTIAAARAHLRKLHPPCAFLPSDLTSNQMHRMSIAAAKFLPQISYTGPGIHRKFIEDVERIALRPEVSQKKDWPPEVFLAAVLAARKALYSAGIVQNSTSTEGC